MMTRPFVRIFLPLLVVVLSIIFVVDAGSVNVDVDVDVDLDLDLDMDMDELFIESMGSRDLEVLPHHQQQQQQHENAFNINRPIRRTKVREFNYSPTPQSSTAVSLQKTDNLLNNKARKVNIISQSMNPATSSKIPKPRRLENSVDLETNEILSDTIFDHKETGEELQSPGVSNTPSANQAVKLNAGRLYFNARRPVTMRALHRHERRRQVFQQQRERLERARLEEEKQQQHQRYLKYLEELRQRTSSKKAKPTPQQPSKQIEQQQELEVEKQQQPQQSEPEQPISPFKQPLQSLTILLHNITTAITPLTTDLSAFSSHLIHFPDPVPQYSQWSELVQYDSFTIPHLMISKPRLTEISESLQKQFTTQRPICEQILAQISQSIQQIESIAQTTLVNSDIRVELIDVLRQLSARMYAQFLGYSTGLSEFEKFVTPTGAHLLHDEEDHDDRLRAEQVQLKFDPLERSLKAVMHTTSKMFKGVLKFGELTGVNMYALIKESIPYEEA